MNRSKYFFFFVLNLILFSSCEDVIELDLETTEPRLVIEATLDAGNQIATVLISQTNDFYDEDPINTVSDATVSLQSESGNIYQLQEDTAGKYTANNIGISTGELFTISVEVAGEVYEASTRVPQPVVLEEIERLESFNNPLGDIGDGTVRLAANWNDPENIQNYYRIRAYIDDEFQSGIYTVLSDEFTGDGGPQSIPIRYQFEENTTVSLELLSTDAQYFDYFFQLSTATGAGFGSTTPYNPQGNFSNGALGYFGIYYSSILSVAL